MRSNIKGQLEVLMAIENIRAELKRDMSNLNMMHTVERLTNVYMLLNTDTLIEALLKAEGISLSNKAS